MRVVITGATGFIGRALVSRMVSDRHDVAIVTRDPARAQLSLPSGVAIEVWDGRTVSGWARHIEHADAVVNLAGEPIAGKRWSVLQKQRILASRVEATEGIVESFRQSPRRPRVLVNASAVGFYGSVEKDEVTEERPKGEGFLSDTVAIWENTARGAMELGVRVALMRFGVVLGRDGRALDRMVLPFRLFVGGPIGAGRQWFPWVHLDDLIGALMFALSDSTLSGPVNVAAPGAVTMREFSRVLGRVLHRPAAFPVPGFLLKVVLGEMAEMLLTGQQVRPKKLLEKGFSFRFPIVEGALRDILR